MMCFYISEGGVTDVGLNADRSARETIAGVAPAYGDLSSTVDKEVRLDFKNGGILLDWV